jgi:hypothetical protein
MRIELRASLEDARNRVAELETQNLDAKPDIDSLKAVLTMYFGTPNVFITLWFELDYETNMTLGTLMV